MAKTSLSLILAGSVISILVANLSLDSIANAQVKQQSDHKIKGDSVGALPNKSKRFALVIGVDQYDDPQIPRLEGAGNDAKSLADALVKYAGFPEEQVFLLTNDQPPDRRPTRANIYRRFSNLRSNIPQDGLLLVSFAGHGVEFNGQAYLLPADAQADMPLLEETSISVERAKTLIKQLSVKQVVFILDACRNNPEEGRGLRAQPLTETYTRGLSFNRINENIDAFAILFATEKGLTAYENKDKKQGYFSLALVEGLKGAAKNEKGEVTLAGLVKYVQETVPKRVSLDLGKGKQQRPFANIEGFKANELVLTILPAETLIPVTPTSVANEPNGYHPLAFEAAEKANKGDYDGAISDYTYAVKLDPPHSDEYKQRIAAVYSNRGYAKYHQADYEGATKDFTEAIKIAPNAMFYYARGAMKGTIRDYKGAIEDFTKAIELDPKYAKAYADRGKVYEARGEKEKAKRDFEVAKQLDSNIYTNEKGLEKNSELMGKVKALIGSGAEKANRGDYDGAIEEYSRAINLNPRYSTPYYLRGNAKFNREYFIGFSVDYKLAAAIRSQCKCLDKDDYEVLLAEITKTINLRPNAVDAAVLYQNRGMLHAARDEVKKAVEDFKKAIDVDSKFYLAYMAWGLITIPSDAKEAIKLLTKAIEIRPNSGAAYYLRFEAKHGTDKTDLDQAVKLSPEDFSLLYRRSGIIDSFDHLPWIHR